MIQSRTSLVVAFRLTAIRAVDSFPKRRIAGTRPEVETVTLSAAEVEAAPVDQDVGRRDDVVRVMERLAHAHEDHVRELLLVPEEAPRLDYLVHDFGRRELRLQPHLRREAELAVDRATDLAGDAEGVSVFRRDEDALDPEAPLSVRQRILRVPSVALKTSSTSRTSRRARSARVCRNAFDMSVMSAKSSTRCAYIHFQELLDAELLLPHLVDEPRAQLLVRHRLEQQLAFGVCLGLSHFRLVAGTRRTLAEMT